MVYRADVPALPAVGHAVAFAINAALVGSTALLLR